MGGSGISRLRHGISSPAGKVAAEMGLHAHFAASRCARRDQVTAEMNAASVRLSLRLLWTASAG